MSDNSIFIGAESGGGNPQKLELGWANRNGLIAGATGTGKTVTLQGIVEGLSAAGVPTFVAHVKGDLAGLGMAGSPTAKTHDIFKARADDIGYAGWQYCDCSTLRLSASNFACSASRKGSKPNGQRQQAQANARAAREEARPTMTDKVIQSATRAAASSIGRQLGNQLLRGILGGLMRGR